MKQRAPVLPDSPNFQQLWDTLGSSVLELSIGLLKIKSAIGAYVWEIKECCGGARGNFPSECVV